MSSPARRTPPKLPRPEPAPVVSSPAIEALRRRVAVEGAEAEFWAGAVSPIIEPVDAAPSERIVTFLWRDAEAEAVLLFVNRLTDESDLGASLMRRIPGTGIWHLSYRMRADWRASYAYLPHRPGQRAPWVDREDHVSLRQALDKGIPDPRNPSSNVNYSGAIFSVVALPDAPAQPWLHPRDDAPRGTLTRHRAPGERGVQVYTPPGATADSAYPVVMFFDGEAWTGPQDAPTTLDNLIADDVVRPCYAILVDSGDVAHRWTTLGADGDTDRWVATELLPWAREMFPLSPHRTDITVVGQSLGGATALLTLARYPHVVGQAISQSASLWQETVMTEITTADLRGTRAYVEVGLQEWVLLPLHRDLAAHLRVAGAAVDYVEFNGRHDSACWRGGIADGLRRLAADIPENTGDS